LDSYTIIYLFGVNLSNHTHVGDEATSNNAVIPTNIDDPVSANRQNLPKISPTLEASEASAPHGNTAGGNS
jgi:hypothetical protein